MPGDSSSGAPGAAVYTSSPDSPDNGGRVFPRDHGQGGFPECLHQIASLVNKKQNHYMEAVWRAKQQVEFIILNQIIVYSVCFPFSGVYNFPV